MMAGENNAPAENDVSEATHRSEMRSEPDRGNPPALARAADDRY
jgi:hypothetical protein